MKPLEVEMVRTALMSVLGLGLLQACAPEVEAPSEAALAQAASKSEAAADQLFVSLRDELMGAMQNGGPVAAVAVCKERAPVTAAGLEAETGVDIERTALRVRNPANAPSEWERGVMEAFAQRRAGGEDFASMSATRVVDGELHWMRPIPMGEVCVMCHGDAEVAAETLAAVADAYPDDAATGFAVGELRGAFVARTPLAD